MRILFRVAYDGAAFAGWQRQPGDPSVQETIEGGLAAITGTRVAIHGAGRTDAGVHALGQCFHADLASPVLAMAGWVRALNARLPATVRIISARRVADDFHARFSATGKNYRYLFRTRAVLPPHEAGRVWHFPHAIDEALLRSTAQLFVGPHDFAAFSANRGKAYHGTVRTIHDIRIRRSGTLWSLDVRGDGFLYKMLRMLTGAIVRCASGRASPDAIAALLARPDAKWHHVAPADGLYLVSVIY